MTAPHSREPFSPDRRQRLERASKSGAGLQRTDISALKRPNQPAGRSGETAEKAEAESDIPGGSMLCCWRCSDVRVVVGELETPKRLGQKGVGVFRGLP